ncbi:MULTISPECIES: ABC transporter substrate-binding protein [Streptomyces]|uniref:ABC transporter substrate-binding protein n=1 Tax=Streptomyces TaxID=1883 RepID=UPI0004C75BA7|nr:MULTISPECIES: ABC transporter substrate-binding protein [Streptomyces]WSF78797.1 ABC transporter substrate-binding protein [Streptomyces globisporus]RDL02647.1 iron complex transport system substrate-binding protein [Streptomyces sp. HB202]UIZ13181.1 ABC transporter substrate-binding protein [Streptomyces sp. R527F]WSQ93854.1 ABC transporter substrate-binding protein [Streptomyces globisporus]WSV91821.1 ABC transporter substrate-binding protein [Streptomyces globisporus]
MSRRTPALIAAAVLLPLALTACSSSSDGDAATGDKESATGEGFPYTVKNCGVTTTYKTPPKRVVTMNQHVTEIMLELGLKKSLVGTAYLDDKVLPKYAKDYASVPVLAKEYPSYEQVLAANPDFVYGGYASAFTAGDGRGREAFKKSGIETRLNTESCTKGDQPMDTLYEEIREVGRTFGISDRAEAWVKQAKADNAATAKKLADLKPVSVFVYDSGDKTAFTAGGEGIGNELIERAGGTNVFADLDKPFGDASWENVVDRKPDVIVIYDYGATTVEQKKKRLLTDPALADVPAIKNKRFAVMPLSDAVLGVRVPAAVDKLAAQLHPETVKAATTP